MFTSGEHRWQDCKTVVSAYCPVVDLQMGVIMDEIATGASTNLANSDPMDFVAKVAQAPASTGSGHVVLAPLVDTDYLLSAMIAAALMGRFYATPQDCLNQDESPRGIMYTEKYKRGCISRFHGAVSAALADELPTLPQLVRAIALAPGSCFKFYLSERKLCTKTVNRAFSRGLAFSPSRATVLPRRRSTNPRSVLPGWSGRMSSGVLPVGCIS